MLKVKSIFIPTIFDQQPAIHTLSAQEINQKSWIIGRDEGCDLQLDDPAITGIHSKIQLFKGQLYFSDAGSTNGSSINGQELAPDELCELHQGDKIQVGQTLLYIEDIALRPEANLDISLWIDQSLEVECVGIIEETSDTKTFQFRKEGVWFSYLPGQFVPIEVEIEGTRVIRPYTISSPPTRPELLELTIRRVKKSENAVSVSNWMHDHFNVGDSLRLASGAKGRFTPAPEFPEKLLLIAGGSGITPMMSIAKSLYDANPGSDVVLVYSIRTANDWIFRAEMQFMAQRYPQFRPRITLTRPESKAWFGLTGHIDRSMIEMAASDWSDRAVFVCGSDPFMQAMRQTFEAMDFPMERYREESFGSGADSLAQADAESLPTIGTSNGKAPRLTSKLPATSTPTQSAANHSTGPSVCFVHSNQTVEADPDEKLLEVAERTRVTIESSCYSGRCGKCKVKVQGQVEYRNAKPDPAALSQQDQQDGYALACIGHPVGAVEVEA